MILLAIAVFISGGEIIHIWKRERSKITLEHVLRAFGFGGLFLAVVVGFGAISWLISVVANNGITFLWWVSEKTRIPFLLVMFIWPLPLVAAVFAIGYFRRFRKKKGE